MKELTENLKTLLRQLKNHQSVIRSSAEQNFPIIMSQNKMHEEKDRLKKTVKKRLTNCSKKSTVFLKKKKPKEDLELNVPIVTSVDELVGKKVKHLTFDYNGEEKCFPVVAVFQRPNSDTELVIRYDYEDRLYSFNFSAFQNFFLKLLPVTRVDFIGKRIRQRFKNDEGNDIWWEQGIVICKDLSNFSDFLVNVFGNEDYHESESSLNVYELLALPV